jgi:hypothetical protein
VDVAGRRPVAGPQLTDLERLIAERQDQLRGRPRDWIDDFGDWRRRVDWTRVAIIVGALLLPFAMMWLLP